MKKIHIIILISIALTLLGLTIEKPHPYLIGNICESIYSLDNWCYGVTTANGYPLSVYIHDTHLSLHGLHTKFANLFINFFFYFGIIYLISSRKKKSK